MGEWVKSDWLPVWRLDGEYGSAMVRWSDGVWDAILRVPGEYEGQVWGMRVDLPLGEPTKVYFTSADAAKLRAERGLANYEDAVRRGYSYEYVYPPSDDVGWSSDHVRSNLGVWR